jgi:signal transduction histidine kinase
MAEPLLGLLVAGLTLIVLAAAAVLWAGTGARRLSGRTPQEDQFRQAMHDLLLYSPDRETLARRAVTWAERLVGGRGAFLVDSDGAILAADGLDPEEVRAIVATNHLDPASAAIHRPGFEHGVLVLPLDLQAGRGAMVIVAGPAAPIPDDRDLKRLRQYATSITAGLERVTLNTRIHALERAKTDLLSVASHEIRGPMTVIKGYLTMMESGSLGELSPKAQSVLPLLISKSDEINWMIERMIETARLEDGRLELNKIGCDVLELTEAAILGMRMQVSGHHLRLDKPSEPVEAEVDPDRIQIVVRNLLSNAAKYSPSGSEIAVGVRREGGMATVSVADQGVGIAPEDQARLFTRFARVASTKHVQGTGLGLWLSREIARMHGGDLTVMSSPGGGSTFVLAVPLKL